jgi:hypothetical protein
MRMFSRIRLHSVVYMAGLSPSFAFSASSPPPTVAEIVSRSSAANTADWKAQPEYAYRERSETAKLATNGEVNSRQVKTYEVMMSGGSPYNRLISVNGEPLSASQEEQEKKNLKREIKKRESESPAERENRVAKYRKDRAEERLLMQQMTAAFKFTLFGEQNVEGVACYVLDAKPDPDYKPPVERARVLTGMEGRLYISKAGYHWVKVQAQVISPVDFGFFIAKVSPGTKFELVQAPVGNVWLPKQFSQSVNASVLGFYGVRSREKDTFSEYHRAALNAGAAVLNQ